MTLFLRQGKANGPSDTEGGAARAFEFSRRLFAEGVFAQAVGFPTVAEGKARIRTIVTATHKRAELEQALEILSRVGKSLGII